MTDFVAFAINGRGAVEMRPGRNPSDFDEIYWIRIRDEEGLIVDVDEHFNITWHGDEDACKTRLGRVLVKTHESFDPSDVSSFSLDQPLKVTETPLCEFCNRHLTRGAAQSGKPTYFCTNFECANRLKTVYSGVASTPEESPDAA